MLKGRHSISNASVIECTADLVAAYIPPHGKVLHSTQLSLRWNNERLEMFIPLSDDRANSDKHSLPASSHVREYRTIYSENRKNVRVEGSLDLLKG